MIAVAAALTTAWLILLVPWRAPARALAPLRPVSSSTTAAWFRWGGPVWGASLALTVLWIHPLAAVAVLAWPSWRDISSNRRRGLERRHDAVRALSETADLVGLGITGGMSIRAAVGHAAPWADEPYRGVFIEALRRAEAGEAFADALDAASADLDPAGRPLIRLLVAAETDGGGLSGGLVRVSDEARHRRRSAAEIRARRLPVTMLLPLVLCVLPAFGLLAVAPLVLTSLGDLDLGL